ncbi:PAS domain-containing protein [Candidatus Poribacteria bacterium]|nr:PAS domain-containing protein [Candidatus Poribacteria bacterium]
MTIASNIPNSLLSHELLALFRLGLCIADGELRVTEWNPVLRELGFGGADVLGRPLLEVLETVCRDKREAERVLRAARGALRGRTTAARQDIAPSGAPHRRRPFHIVAVPMQGEDASPRAGLVFIESGEGQEVREQFERILDSTPDGIMVIDPQRHVRIFNRACGELLGRDPGEVIRTGCACGEVVGCHMRDGTPLSGNQLCPANELFLGTRHHQVEEMLTTTAAGEERWIETSYSAILDPSGKVEFVIGILRDVHERKRLEDRLRQSEKLASLGELTAGIAHEIKNPLGIILSSVEIILDEARPRDMQREAARFIRDEVRRLDARVRSFLSFARPQPAHLQPVLLNGLIRRTVAGSAPAFEGVALEMDLEQPEAIVALDEDQIRQVLTNLILNAAEAVSGRGRILVRTRTKATSLVLEVHDDGPGVPVDSRIRIFDPFYTTKANGTGLGLSIVSQIANAHEATACALDSTILGGACFRLALPLPMVPGHGAAPGQSSAMCS